MSYPRIEPVSLFLVGSILGNGSPIANPNNYGLGALFGWPCEDNSSVGFGPGGSYTPSEPAIDHTESMLDFVNDLNSCAKHTQWTPFGSRKICFDYFDGRKRRTRTMFANENYFIYKKMKVQAKHQRKRSALVTHYWDRKKTDEAAILINQACFRIKNSDYVAPMPQNFQSQHQLSQKWFFIQKTILLNQLIIG